MVAAISFCLIGGTSPVLADIINVPGDFLTIQEAIDAATDGDEVKVDPGIYLETINFLGKAIWLHSSDGPEVTIIDAQQTGTVVTCNSGEGSDTVLEGFTITGGSADSGGGMLNENSSPTVTNCTFSGNTASDEFGRGGGMYIDSGNPVISDCTFTENMAEFRGGGIYLRDGSMTVTNCTFEGNSTPVVGQHGGGAIFSRDSLLNLVDCDLIENEGYHGGAVAFTHFSGADVDLTLTGCSVTNNSAVAGGGVFVHNAAALLVNSTLISNQANGEFGIGGGIVLLSDSSGVLVNTTIIANSASEGGAIWVGGGSAMVRNSILWDNIPNHISGPATLRYTDIEGGWAGAGSANIDADPLFVDPDNGDYRLSSGSLCIDAAANFYLPDELDTDFDGNPRFIDDPTMKDTGVVDCPIVDMGSFEFQEGTTDCCPWDLDDSGSVGASDVLALLASWGLCKDCPADFDEDGFVGASDLLALLANWGLCP